MIDLVRDDGLLVEIQTRGFSSMRAKVVSLLEEGHRLRVVHPITVDKTIVKVGPDGEVVSRRLSPKHGDPVDVCAELVSFPHLLAEPGFELDLVMTVEEEYRVHNPEKAWRRNGWTVAERHLVEVTGSLLMTGLEGLAALLPADLPAAFTTADLASYLGRPRRVAQQMAYCLRETALIEATGKRGRAIEYRVAAG